MTKSDLITIIADRLKFPWARAELLVDVVFGCLEQSIRRGEKIEIRGFGTFQVRSYRAYRGRNPRTGQIVDVSPKRLPHFKVGRELAVRNLRGDDGNVGINRSPVRAIVLPDPIPEQLLLALSNSRSPTRRHPGRST